MLPKTTNINDNHAPLKQQIIMIIMLLKQQIIMIIMLLKQQIIMIIMLIKKN